MGLSAAKRAYYEEHLEAWGNSSLTQVEYCKQFNIAYGSFKTWTGKLKQSEAVKTEFLKQRLQGSKILVRFYKSLCLMGFELE